LKRSRELKIVLALLVGALFALYLNLSPIMPIDKVFFTGLETENEETGEVEIKYPYYTIKDVGELNWKFWNGVYFDVVAESEDGCDSTPRLPKTTTFYKFYGGTNLYWVRTAETADMSVCQPVEDEELVTPYQMTIETQSTSVAASEGTLQLKSEHTGYYIIFNNLKCWYCCTAHEPEEDGTYKHKGTNAAKLGGQLPPGYVAGIASENTTVTFYNSDGNEIAPAEFYNGFQAAL
jgi:hypothetical protein